MKRLVAVLILLFFAVSMSAVLFAGDENDREENRSAEENEAQEEESKPNRDYPREDLDNFYLFVDYSNIDLSTAMAAVKSYYNANEPFYRLDRRMPEIIVETEKKILSPFFTTGYLSSVLAIQIVKLVETHSLKRLRTVSFAASGEPADGKAEVVMTRVYSVKFDAPEGGKRRRFVPEMTLFSLEETNGRWLIADIRDSCTYCGGAGVVKVSVGEDFEEVVCSECGGEKWLKDPDLDFDNFRPVSVSTVEPDVSSCKKVVETFLRTMVRLGDTLQSKLVAKYLPVIRKRVETFFVPSLVEEFERAVADTVDREKELAATFELKAGRHAAPSLGVVMMPYRIIRSRGKDPNGGKEGAPQATETIYRFRVERENRNRIRSPWHIARIDGICRTCGGEGLCSGIKCSDCKGTGFYPLADPVQDLR